MSFEATFTMKRSDTTTDFWWEATTPEIVEMCQKIDLLSKTQNIQRFSGKSADGKTYESRFIASDRAAWNHFMNSIIIEIPNMLEKRNAYLASAGHTIQMVINDVKNESEIKSTDPTWKLGD